MNKEELVKQYQDYKEYKKLKKSIKATRNYYRGAVNDIPLIVSMGMFGTGLFSFLFTVLDLSNKTAEKFNSLLDKAYANGEFDAIMGNVGASTQEELEYYMNEMEHFFENSATSGELTDPLWIQYYNYDQIINELMNQANNAISVFDSDVLPFAIGIMGIFALKGALHLKNCINCQSTYKIERNVEKYLKENQDNNSAKQQKRNDELLELQSSMESAYNRYIWEKSL